MAKVLKCDWSSGDAYVTKNLNLVGGDGTAQFTIRWDFLITQECADSGNNGDLLQLWGGSWYDGIHQLTSNDYRLDGDFRSAGGGFTYYQNFYPDQWWKNMSVTYSSNGTSGYLLWKNESGSQMYNYFVGYSGGSFNTLDLIKVGAVQTSGPGNIYYLANVVVVDASGNVVFSDDFSSGDLSKWDSSTGSVSVVNDPTQGSSGTQYDDIGDAYVMIVDGAEHTVTIDTTNATSQDPFGPDRPGETYWLWGSPPQKTCWMVVDMSTAGPASTIDYSIQSLTPGFIPESDMYAPTDTSWDANTPNFANIGSVTGGGNGDGTENPGNTTVFFTPSRLTSVNGKYYIALDDWNFAGGSGVFQITYKVTIKNQKTCIDATTIAYTNSPTVDVGGGSVGDSQYIQSQDILQGDSDLNPTLRLEGANLPEPGQYRVWLSTDDPNQEGFLLLIKRNGLPLLPMANLYAPPGESVEATGYGWLNGERTANNSVAPTVVPIAAGDVIDFCMFVQGGTTTCRLTKLCLFQMSKGGIQGPAISILGQPEVLGASSNPLSIIDSTANLIDSTVTNFTGWLTGDICVTANGNVYVMYTLDDYGHNMHLWEWDGSAWNHISNNVAGSNGTETGTLEPIYWCSIDAHQNTVYMAYGFNNGTTTNGYKNTAIYVKKYESGVLSSIVPSTGLLGFTHTALESWVGSETQSVTLKCSPAGVPWVVWPEVIDYIHADYSGGTRPFAACYQGGTSWMVTQLPDPPDLTGIAPNFSGGGDIRTGWGCSFIADCQQMDLVFSHAGTPSENPTVVYFANYWYSDSATTPLGEIITSYWDGSQWIETAQSKVSEIWGMGDPPTGFGTLGQGYWNWWSEGTRLVASDDTIYIVLALGHTQYADRGVAGKMLADGSGFVSLDPEIDPEQTGAGLWSWLGDPENFSTGRWGGGWDYPSVTANVDPNGLLFVQWTGSIADYGDVIAIAKESGTTDGWTAACKHALPLMSPITTETTHFVFDPDGNMYFLEFLSSSTPPAYTSIVVIKYPREDYAPWTATHAVPNVSVSVDHAYGRRR